MPHLRLDNRPLLGTVDRDLFVAPARWGRLVAASARSLNVLMLGAAGSGKTTVLRALEAETQADGPPALYVDLNPADDAEQALLLITEALVLKWEDFGRTYARAQTLADASDRMRVIRDTLSFTDAAALRLPPAQSETQRLLGLVRSLADAPATKLLLDGPPGDGAGFTLFGRLRDELWQLGHQWIVAAEESQRSEYSRPPASAFFDVRVDLEPLALAEQRDLLERRLGGGLPAIVDALVGRTDGLPRSLVSIAREAVLSGRPVDELLVELDAVRSRLDEQPPAARRVIAFLADHGPTSGSSEMLLSALGISAQRARRLLAELEADGLVRSFPEPSSGQGRPRKLYELTETRL